jgi:hypothetical protein
MKQIFLALMVIVATVSLATVGIYAGFVDTETSEGNIIQADSIDLFLSNPYGIGEQSGHSVLRTWHFENRYPTPGLLEPGDVLTSQIILKAFGSSTAHHVDIICRNVNLELDWDISSENAREAEILGEPVDPSPNHGIYDKDTVMIITNLTYHIIPIIWGEYNSFNPAYIEDMTGDGRISLDELEAQGLHGLPPVPDDGGQMTFSMTVKFADGTWNEYQGDETQMTLIFALMGQ